MKHTGAPFETYHEGDLVVSNRNINLMLNYCKKKGVPEGDMLAHLGYPEAYLKNPDHWVSLPVYHEITLRTRRLFDDDPSIFYEIGLAATQEGGLGVVEVLKRAMGAIFVDPGFLIKRIPAYNQFFNKTKDIDLVEVQDDTAIMRVTFRPGINAIYDFNSGPLIKGIVASLPTVWGLPAARVDEVMLAYDVVHLLRDEFSIFSEVRNGLLIIEGQVYGRIVELQATQTGKGMVYLGTCKEIEDLKATQAVLITRELEHKNYPLLIPGQIYNAPYFILRVQWDHLPFLSRVVRALPLRLFKQSVDLRELEERTSYFQRYARELEGTINERNKIILQEKQEVERLKNKLNEILTSNLPSDLVEAMVSNKLAPRRRSGVVLFADLVGFSKRVHASDDFYPMLQDLNRFFELCNTVIRSRGGWVYKYLGDGIMAVFGGYRDDEDYAVLARGALEAADTIRTLVNEMGWHIRIGVEYGEFIAGEIGPPGARIWDFLGETVNFSCRIGQHAESNEIMIGPNCLELIAAQVTQQSRTLMLKGIGEHTAHLFVSFN